MIHRFRAIFNYRGEKPFPWQSRIGLAIVFVSGLVFWGNFLNWGKLESYFEDWAYVSMPRLAFLKYAIRDLTLPLHMPDASALSNISDRFMSIPDVILSPQILFLGILGLMPFVLFNVLFQYTIGFWGLLKLRKRFRLSLVVFLAAFLLFNFNGHILSHLAIGHVNWGGYFLYPWFVLMVLRFVEGERSWRWVLFGALIFFLVFLQGAYHQYVWMLIFFGVTGIVYWRNFFAAFKVLVFANLLSMVRILPAVIQIGEFDQEFLGGFLLKRYMLGVMLSARAPETGQVFKTFPNPLGYWELNLYVGLLGILFLVFFAGLMFITRQTLVVGMQWAKTFDKEIVEKKQSGAWHSLSRIFSWFSKFDGLREDARPKLLGLLIPVALMGWLSIRDNYNILKQIPIPMLSGERVATRFLVLSFVFLLFLAVLEYQWLLNRVQKLWPLQILLLGLSGYLAFDLWQHSTMWRITEMFTVFPMLQVDLDGKVVSNHPDPIYHLLLTIGLLVSVFSLVFLIWLSRREKIVSDIPQEREVCLVSNR